MIHLLTLTPVLASTTFSGIPCTDRCHFDNDNIPSRSICPGEWEPGSTSPGPHKQPGHRHCKFPRKQIVVDDEGNFAIVHGKSTSLAGGFRLVSPSKKVLEFFLSRSVAISGVDEKEGGKEVDVNDQQNLSEGEAGWEMVDGVDAEEEYVVM